MVFEEVAEVELIPKAMALIHSDMRAALDHYGDNALPDFAVMTDGVVDEFSYPLLSLANDSGASAETNSGEWLDQELRFSAALVVSGATVAQVRDRAKRYKRALVRVIRNGILQILPEGSDYFDYTIGFRWRYFRHGTKGTLFTQPVEIETTVTFGEK